MSLAQRIRRLLASPQSKRLIEQGQRELAKPATQRKLRDLVTRLTRGRRH